MHRNWDQTFIPPDRLHLKKQAQEALPIEWNICAPVVKLQPVDGQADPLFIEKDGSAFVIYMAVHFAVGTVFLLRGVQGFSAVHAVWFPDIRKFSLAAFADPAFRRKQDCFTDDAAGRIEEIQEKRAGLLYAAGYGGGKGRE